MENRGYNLGKVIAAYLSSMPRQQFERLTDFGKRLVALRNAAGFTQVELAKELGVSQRMVSYYEGHTEHPPSTVLPDLARVLGVSADQLLGMKPIKKGTPPPDTRLHRRFKQIEKMGSKERRQIMLLLDTFIEREQLREKVST